MPGVISTMLTSYRSLLQAAPASLVNVPDTFKIDDLPAGGVHRHFRLRQVSGDRLQQIYGGGVNSEYECDVSLEIHWDPQIGGDGAWNTISDDLANARAVMLKTGNRTAGILWVHPGSEMKAEPLTVNQIAAIGTFVVRYRDTQDLT